jgi:hypothetical protein
MSRFPEKPGRYEGLPEDRPLDRLVEGGRVCDMAGGFEPGPRTTSIVDTPRL